MSLLKNILLSIFLVGSCYFLHAETPELDSLYVIMHTTSSDSTRVEIMNLLSEKLKQKNWREALKHAEQAYEISKKIDHKEETAKALLKIGQITYRNIDRDTSLYYFKQGVKLAEEENLLALEYDYFIELGLWHMYRSRDSIQTVQYFLKAAEISKITKDHMGTGRAYARLAALYARKRDIEQSEKYMELSTPYYKKINDISSIAFYYEDVGSRVWAYNMKRGMDFYLKGLEYAPNNPNINVGIGKAYSLIGKPEAALEYLEDAVKAFDRKKQVRRLGSTLAYLADVHIQLGNYEEANKISDENIALLSPLSINKEKRALPLSFISKGIINEQQGNIDEAQRYYQMALDKALTIRSSYERAKARLVLGQFYIDSNLTEAALYCRKALKDSRKHDYVAIQVEACDCLYQVYKKQDNHSEALEYFEQKEVLAASLNAQKATHTLDIYGKLADKDREIAYQQKLKDEQLKSQYKINKILGGSVVAGFILIGFLMLGIRRISNQNKEIKKKTKELESTNISLERSNTELERFASIVSHDLKTPLKNIVGFTGLLKKKLNKQEESLVQDALKFIDDGGKRMVRLIDDVLEYSKFSNIEATDNTKVINVSHLIEEITQLVLINIEDGQVKADTSTLPNLEWNYSKIFLLFKNFIENGLKYNESSQPLVKIYGKKSLEAYCVCIEDNGIGISKEYFDKIFVMFKRLHNHKEYEGTGLGLATCKKIVEEFEGSINIDSEIGKGTKFQIYFPIKMIHESDNPANFKGTIVQKTG